MSETGNKLRACCKIHGGDNNQAFEVNIDKNMWYCHSACKIGGDAISLVQIMERCDFFSAVNTLCNIFNVNIEDMEYEKGVERGYEESQKFFESLEVQHSITSFIPPSVDTVQVKEYRNISNDTCREFDLRFTHSYPIMDGDRQRDGKSVYDKIIFDVKMDGRLLGQSLRSVRKDDSLRWLHMPTGFKRSQILFNYDKCVEYMQSTLCTSIIVVEGIMDVLRVYDAGHYNVVSPLGCSLSVKQISLLSAISTTLILMFDGDSAGALATEKYSVLLRKTFDVYKCILPKGCDPCDLTNEEVKEIIKNKVRVL